MRAVGSSPATPPATSGEAAEESDYVGLSEVSSSSYPAGAKDDDGEEEAGDEGEELELGLSLGVNKVAGSGSGAGGGRDGARWGEYRRILTAEDFPSLGSHVLPLSSSSSVSSSSSAGGGDGSGGRETRRVADSSARNTGGSATPPRFSYGNNQTVVGWPPIRAYRMNSLMNQSKDNISSNAYAMTTHKNTSHGKSKTDEITGNEDLERKGRLARSSVFVKVNMDGDPIGRKVDLTAHQSYETLALALETMFQRPKSALDGARTAKLSDGSSEYALTYEDKDGDWMLVGDVPWGMFLNTVKRLRIVRTSDRNGLVVVQH